MPDPTDLTVDPHRVLAGIGVCAGTASAPIVLVSPAPGVDEDEPPCTDPAADGQRVRDAMKAVADDLTARAEATDGTTRQILETTAQLATDRAIAKAVDKQLKKGSGITRAVHDATATYAEMLAQLGGYMAERVTDLMDVRDRVICELRGVPAPGVPRLEQPTIVVARDLAPAETATLDPELVVGIVTEQGGPTSHTAILAAQLGIPAVVRVSGALELTSDDHLAIDGGAGRVIVSPTDEEVAELAERARRREAALADSHGSGRTADGHGVPLLANIGTADDARRAATQDVEGSGLFRTEFLFLDREQAPTLEEQTETYTTVLEAFGDRKVVVRTLDAGADKPLVFADQGEEENPALGVRGLRLSRAREDLLDTQLEALAAAHRATGGDLHVMAPMVATVEEARWFAEKVRATGLPHVGVMIEVPAAAINARHLLAEVDFASIGTNDLSQYTYAADRMQGELADLLSPWQPALLAMVQAACVGGAETDSPIGVCGEAGGDPLVALVLVGLGVSTLSMAPGKVTAVRAALARHDLATCQEMARRTVAAPTAEAARQAVIDLAHPEVLDLL